MAVLVALMSINPGQESEAHLSEHSLENRLETLTTGDAEAGAAKSSYNLALYRRSQKEEGKQALEKNTPRYSTECPEFGQSSSPHPSK